MAKASKQPKGGGKKSSAAPVNVPKGAKTSLFQGYKKGK